MNFVDGGACCGQLHPLVASYERAARQGDAEAQCDLARCYDYGIGIDTDCKMALHWYEKAAKQGHKKGAHWAANLCVECGWRRKGAELMWLTHPDAAAARVSITTSLEELFIYGRLTLLDPDKAREMDKCNPHVLDRARRVYNESATRARSAALCWVHANALCNKDMSRFIGQLVWQSREDAVAWCGPEF